MVFIIVMLVNEFFFEDEEGRFLIFSGCVVILQVRKLNVYGKVYQKWRYDVEIGYIYVFFINLYDKGKLI